jgi:predicted nucleic acid-binding protein
MGARSKVVLDTNIFISAFGWRGIPWSIVDLEDIDIDDPDDVKIVSCAVAAKAHCIISGDPHLLELVSYRTIAILNPAAFISSIR